MAAKRCGKIMPVMLSARLRCCFRFSVPFKAVVSDSLHTHRTPLPNGRPKKCNFGLFLGGIRQDLCVCNRITDSWVYIAAQYASITGIRKIKEITVELKNPLNDG